MKRYVWLGDSKYGGSVLWDARKGAAVRTDVTKMISAKDKQRNVIVIISVLVLSLLIRFAGYLMIPTDKLNSLSIFYFSLFITVMLVIFIKQSIYGHQAVYIETSIEDAMYAIRSTGYLRNPWIAMMVDKTLMNLILAMLISSIIFGFLEFTPFFGSIEDYIKFVPMILLISIPIRMIYFINFKKENTLKL
ncbi:hypothetical protein ESZ50_07415 [Weissella muntiaci]|uniref:Uncharacterized protein n=1 Tax=Weissella muntiaci TaxID=2508881 RepID=A0A6C2C634_9LACO|nr:hypothetical protein [Weissella muntiaci]TYC49066.1 hypothetical protein ESZ50_07415 [Weissella muntiaci]